MSIDRWLGTQDTHGGMSMAGLGAVADDAPSSVLSPQRPWSSRWPWSPAQWLPRRPGQPRPVGEQGQRLAERQPQRQQLEVPRGRHRPVPARDGGDVGREPLDPHQLRLHRRAATRRTTSSRRWNVTNAKGKICAGAGRRRSRRSAPRCGTASTFAFPSDGYKANGLSVHGAEVYSAAPRRLTIYGGTITSISGPVHAGSPDGNSTADFLVRFKATRSSVLLAWGGHLAQSAYWDTSRGGPRDGASMVSGAPWHIRTLQLDGSGNKNQDRSIQPSAIVGELPPFALAPPTPTPRPTNPAAAPPPPSRCAGAGRPPHDEPANPPPGGGGS